MVMLHGHRKHKKVGISKRANISDSAKIGADCHIHDFATISDDAKIGDGCIIYPCAYIGQGVQIGNDCVIHPNVTIYYACKIGNRVIINANSTIGQDGFGYASQGGVHHKIPQTGIVIIEDDVELIEATKVGLEDKGYRVSSANNKAEGAKAVEKICPNLIIMDVMMDKMSDGFDLSRKLKR